MGWGILILVLVAPDVLGGVMQQVVCDEGEQMLSWQDFMSTGV